MSFAPAYSRISLNSVRSTRSVSRRRPLAVALLAATLSLTILSPWARAQSPGSLDSGFSVLVNDLTVFTVNLQLNVNGAEQVIAGGDTLQLFRYALDGTIDEGFSLPVTLGSATNRTVYTLAFEQTVANTAVGTYASRIYIGGDFGQNVDALIPQNIVRLNYDGGIDYNFYPGEGANGEVTAILPLGNFIGSPLLVGGVFTLFAGAEHNYLVKLNSDGSVDSTYNPALTVGDSVFSLAQQLDQTTGLPNGQVLVAGAFNRINKGLPAKLARLNSDGTTDTTFIPDFPTRTLCVAVQTDGKILVGGSFNMVNGLPTSNIVRLNQNGSTDPTFSATLTGNVDPVNAPPTAVNTILIAPDGRIYAAGNFLKANGVARKNLARFEPDGTLDTSFDPGALLQNRVQSIVLQTDNNLVIGETRINRPTDNSPYPNVLTRVFGGPPLPTSVSIETTVRTAVKSTADGGIGQNGQVEVIRTGSIINPLTVLLNENGDASFEDDYFLSGDITGAPLASQAVTIQSGSDRALVNVIPRQATGTDAALMKAKVHISASNDYEIVGANKAKVLILTPAQ